LRWVGHRETGHRLPQLQSTAFNAERHKLPRTLAVVDSKKSGAAADKPVDAPQGLSIFARKESPRTYPQIDGRDSLAIVGNDQAIGSGIKRTPLGALAGPGQYKRAKRAAARREHKDGAVLTVAYEDLTVGRGDVTGMEFADGR